MAGGGAADGRPATVVPLNNPVGIALDSAGNLYIADEFNNRIRKVSSNGVMTTIAGSGATGNTGDGGPATAASFYRPEGVAVDRAGNLYIADTLNNRVRKFTAATGIITTVAGTGDYGFYGDGGPATQAFVQGPSAVALDSTGNLLIADRFNNRVRRVDAKTGIISTVAGNGKAGYSGDGGPATAASLSERVEGVAIDSRGDVYIGDGYNNRVRKVEASTGVITTVAGNGTAATSGDGGPANAAAIWDPAGLAFDAEDNLYIAQVIGGLVRRVDRATGTITTVAGGFCDVTPAGECRVGDGRIATEAYLQFPRDVVVTPSGDVIVSDSGQHRVRRVDHATRIITTVAGMGEGGFAPLGDGGPATAATLYLSPYKSEGLWGVTVDRSGNVYVADVNHYRIRKVSGSGIISTVAGNGTTQSGVDGLPATATALGGTPAGLVFDPAGNLLFGAFLRIRKVDAATAILSTVAGGGSFDSLGDGGPATAAYVSDPMGLALDGSGSIYFADNGHKRIRKIDGGSGTITTLAGGGTVRFNNDGLPATAVDLIYPTSVALDSSGNLYIADAIYDRIRKVDRVTGIITTVAGGGPSCGTCSIGDGGPATAATFLTATAVAFDPSGNLYVADANHHRIRKVDHLTGIISTVAGKGESFGQGSYSGDGGPATQAGLSFPNGVAFDPSGNMYIVDTGNNLVRAVYSCVPVATPQLSSPADGSSGVSVAPRLAWNRAKGAFRYDVYLDTVNPPKKIVASDIATTTYAPANLEPLTTYYLQVVAKGDPFCVPFSTNGSAIRSFTTAGGCAVPGAFDVVAPADGSSSVGTSVELSWQPSQRAASYDLYLGPANPPRLFAKGLTATSYSVSGLAPGTSYVWSVAAHASCDATLVAQTAVRSFKTAGACGPAGGFSLSSPPANAGDVSVTPTLSWTASVGAGSYDLYLGTSTNPPLYLADLTQTRVEVPRLAPGGTYNWKVVAKAACDPSLSISSPVASFTVSSSCSAPGSPTITFVPPGSIAAGTTYAITWSEAAGLDAGGSYVIERSSDPSFSSIADRQQTTSTSASFISPGEGSYYHRVRAISGCDPGKASASSEAKAVTVSFGNPDVIFTVQPRTVITKLGDKLEEQKTSFTIENVGRAAVQVLVGRQELGSVPFFSIVDPFGGDSAFLTLEPRKPKTLDLRFSGPPNDQARSYQGIIYLAATGQAFAANPLAYVNLKVGGDVSAAPKFLVNGVESEYAFFPPASGDDSSRPSISVDILNSGSTPMELGAEIGPELWLKLEKDWNTTPIPASSFRPVRLFTQRNRAPNGSALPRYTYLTIRNRAGQSARILVEDNGAVALGSGRIAPLAAGERSYIVPQVVSRTSSAGNTLFSTLRMSNVGGDAVPTDLFFTPEGADGFDGGAVKRATIVIPPNDLVKLTDPLVQIFGLTAPASGSLEIRAAQEKLGLLTISSSVQTMVKSGGGYGYQMPTLQRGEGARMGSAHVIAGITSSANTKTSLILAETTGREKTSVRVTLYDKTGAKRNEQAIEVPRYGTRRIDDVMQALGGGSPVDGGRIEIEAQSGGGAVVGLATITDRTNESASTFVSQGMTPTLILSPLGRRLPTRTEDMASPSGQSITAATQTFVVPAIMNGIAPVPGQPATYSTLLGLTGGAELPSTFKLTYADQESRRSHTQSVTVQPRQTIEYANVVEDLFRIAPGSRSRGWLWVESDANGKAYGRLSAKSNAGGIGDALPVLSPYSEALTGAGSSKPLYADGIEQSIDGTRGTRSNLILNELIGQSATVTVRIYEAGNRTQPIAESDVTLPANGEVRLETLFAALGLDTGRDDLNARGKDRINVECAVVSKSGGGLVSALLTTIDNKTGETKITLLVPAGGVPATGVQRIISPSTGGRRRTVRPH